MGLKPSYSLALAVVLLAATNVWGKTDADREGSRKLADKLLSLSKSLDMKESKFPDSGGGGGKDFDANTGNSFTSNTTYHSYVWDYCENWIGPTQCQRWLDPYVSPHGRDGDRSPLEGMVYEEYQRTRNNGAVQGNQGQYAIWKVASKGGDVLDVQGRLNREELAEFKLMPDVAQKVAKVGTDTATRQINLSYDPEDRDGVTLPNMESLRLMASRWTKMFRNRMVANLGELRANDTGVEFALAEDKPDCDRYLAALRDELDRFRLEERMDTQAKLQNETRTQQLEQRYNLCQQMRQQDVYAVNPKVQGNAIAEAGPDGEQIDKWRSRVNIAAIDYVGIDPNAMPKPGDQQVTKEESTAEMTEYASGGYEDGVVRKSNAEQLQGYNQALESAAQGYKEVVARAGGAIKDESSATLSYRLRPGERNAVDLNSLTGEMKEELSDTGYQTNGGPENELERRPTELTITRR